MQVRKRHIGVLPKKRFYSVCTQSRCDDNYWMVVEASLAVKKNTRSNCIIIFSISTLHIIRNAKGVAKRTTPSQNTDKETKIQIHRNFTEAITTELKIIKQQFQMSSVRRHLNDLQND